jgi:hypothetical protein
MAASVPLILCLSEKRQKEISNLLILYTLPYNDLILPIQRLKLIQTTIKTALYLDQFRM